MSLFQESGFSTIQSLLHSVAQRLVANGFEMIHGYATDGNSYTWTNKTAPAADVGFYVFKSTITVDPVHDSQPWVLGLKMEGTKSLHAWAATEKQLIGGSGEELKFAALDDTKSSGHMSVDHVLDNPFVSSDPTKSNWSCFADGVDLEALSLGYALSITDHGVALSIFSENHDLAGDCASWFCVQRMVKADGSVVSDGFSPLFCVFSQNGGGSSTASSVIADGIQRFIVRESDVSAPSIARSAVAPSADCDPIINPLQQVSLKEGNLFAINMIRGLNSDRYRYEHELDMVAYTGADVIARGSVVNIDPYSEGADRSYLALSANSPNNTGMRILFWNKGA